MEEVPQIPPAVIEFYMYTRSSRDTLAEFLAHYERLYIAANVHEVSPMSGVDNLILLLPAEWKSWAEAIKPHYYCARYLGGDYANFGSFIGALSTQYYTYGVPPPPPYAIPFEFEPEPVPQANPEPEPFIPHQPEPEPELDPSTFISEPSTPVGQVVPYVPEFDLSGYAQDSLFYDHYDSPLNLGRYSTSNGVVDHDDDIAAASDAAGSADHGEGNDSGEADDDEEEDPDEDDPAPFVY